MTASRARSLFTHVSKTQICCGEYELQIALSLLSGIVYSDWVAQLERGSVLVIEGVAANETTHGIHPEVWRVDTQQHHSCKCLLQTMTAVRVLH